MIPFVLFVLINFAKPTKACFCLFYIVHFIVLTHESIKNHKEYSSGICFRIFMKIEISLSLSKSTGKSKILKCNSLKEKRVNEISYCKCGWTNTRKHMLCVYIDPWCELRNKKSIEVNILRHKIVNYPWKRWPSKIVIILRS